MVERVAFFVAFFAEPTDDFVIGNEGGTGALEDFFGVGNVVFVAVRDQYEIGFNVLDVDFSRFWIRRDKGVEEDLVSIDFDGEA